MRWSPFEHSPKRVIVRESSKGAFFENSGIPDYASFFAFYGFLTLFLVKLPNGFIMLFSEGNALAPIQMILIIFIIVAGLTFLAGYGMHYIQSRQD